MKCPQCGAESKGKFCRVCGTKITETTVLPANSCSQCGGEIKSSAKFCAKCGAATASAQPQNSPKSDAVAHGSAIQDYIFWNVQPGQIALKLTEERISHYEKARGLVIHEGTKALIFSGGALAGEFASGTYNFLDGQTKSGRRPQREGGLVGLLSGAGRFLENLVLGRQPHDEVFDAFLRVARTGKPLSVVLARDSEFPLIFDFKKLDTADIRTDIATQVSCRINDLNAFYRDFMVDSELLSAETLAGQLAPTLESAVAATVKTCRVADIGHNSQLMQSILQALATSFRTSFPSLSIARVVKVESSREEIERLRRLSEELYVAEQELVQLNRRNEFSNRLRLAENQQRLQDARTDADFGRQMKEINKDQLLTADDMEKFQTLLANERRIREAKTDDEYQSALDGIRKSGLLRAEDIAILERSIRERSEDHDIQRLTAVNLLEISNKIASDKAMLQWEYEIGDKRIDLEIKRQRQKYEADIGFADLEIQTKRKHDQYGDERRRSQIGLDKEEMGAQLDVARQAQALTEERKKAEHERETATRAQVFGHEKEVLERFAGMTFEQIMASNPNISPEAARALAERFKAQAAGASADDRARMAEQQKTELKEFMEQQMGFMRDMVRSNADIATGVAAGKEREVQRAHAEVDQMGHHMSQVVGSTLAAVGGGQKAQKKCAKCAAMLASDAIFCTECGAKQ